MEALSMVFQIKLNAQNIREAIYTKYCIYLNFAFAIKKINIKYKKGENL